MKLIIGIYFIVVAQPEFFYEQSLKYPLPTTTTICATNLFYIYVFDVLKNKAVNIIILIDFQNNWTTFCLKR